MKARCMRAMPGTDRTVASEKAREAFDRLAEFAHWKNNDLRIRLLGAHLAAAEKSANVKPSAR